MKVGLSGSVCRGQKLGKPGDPGWSKVGPQKIIESAGVSRMGPEVVLCGQGNAGSLVYPGFCCNFARRDPMAV